MPIWLSPWAWTSTDWAGVQAVILVVAAMIALVQLWQARGLQIAQARPFVVVDFDVLAQQQQIYLVISNTGKTVARDVRLTFDPQLTSSFDSMENVVAPRDLKVLREPIPSLPPGKEVRVLLDVFTQRSASYEDVFHVHATYQGPTVKRKFSDETVLDLGIYRNVLHVNRHDIHDVHSVLEKLVAKVGQLGDSLQTRGRT